MQVNNQEVLDNAPEGATHVSDNGVYYRYDSDFIPAVYWARGEEWLENNKITHLCSSLADIKRIAELEKENCKLLSCLLGISDACIGEITMNYRLDASHIGQWICEDTGMTNPQLTEYLKALKEKGNG